MKTQNTFGIIFYLRKYKEKDGKAPLYVRITVDGRRTDIALKRKIDLKNWNDAKGKAKGTSEDIRTLNTFLERIRGRLTECYHELQLEKAFITAEAIKNKYLGVEEEEHSLLNLIDYHNTEMKNVLEWGTLKNYYTTKKYIEMFLKQKMKMSDIFLSRLNYKFLMDFQKFLREYQPKDHQKPCKQNTIMKHTERMRKVVNMAIKYEWLEKDPFVNFKPKFIRNVREFLTHEELNAIEAKQFNIERIDQVRDIFVFSCYTGLSYIDVSKLTPENISIGIDKNQWLYTSRKKTEQPVKIPLLPKALEIIEKYKDHPKVVASGKLLPTYSNQRLNSYLKEIADLCGIKKRLTFHIARHTFATTVTLTNGVPIETVSRLLGHASLRTTQIYAKVVEQKLGEDMDTLKNKLSAKKSDNHSNENVV
ncbi:MAG: site-specific integrase [Bacteroidales bacterium]